MFLFIVMLITKFHNSKINACTCCHSSWRVDAWIQNWLVSSFLTRMGDLVNTVCGLSGKKYYWKNKIFKMIWEYYTNNDNNKIFMLSHISVISYTKWYAYRSLCTNNHYRGSWRGGGYQIPVPSLNLAQIPVPRLIFAKIPVTKFSVCITALFALTYLISSTILRETFSEAIFIFPSQYLPAICKLAELVRWPGKLTERNYATV